MTGTTSEAALRDIVSGLISLICLLRAAHPAASYETLLRRLFADHELVTTFRTMVVLDPGKAAIEVDV
jgi:hypothetical protein